MKNIAVILAGGSGHRLGSELPKQFLKLAGKKVIEHTIDVFELNANIDEICIISHPNHINFVEEMVVQNQYKKVRKILKGGKERYDSSLAAINAYDCDDYNLLFHDSVRPLISDEIINNCIEALKTYSAVDVAIQTTDTIISVNERNCIENIPNRNVLRNGQTPQCFKRGVIKKAYDIALKDPNFLTTDDCGVVKKYLPDTEIVVVNGEAVNMKLTYMEDIFLLDKLFQLKTIKNIKTITHDSEKEIKGKVIVVFGGSYGIGEEIVNIGSGMDAVVVPYSRSLNGLDVADYKSVENALSEVYEEYGKIDDVICTAGILKKEQLCSMSNEDIVQSVNVNLIGAINVAKASFQYLQKTKGSVLLFTSSSYTRGRMMYSIYSSTKAAIVNLVQALAEEWISSGVRINCINPERTKTPMRTSNFGNEPDDSLLKAEEVAKASINTLCSKFTGEVIDVKIK